MVRNSLLMSSWHKQRQRQRQRTATHKYTNTPIHFCQWRQPQQNTRTQKHNAAILSPVHKAMNNKRWERLAFVFNLCLFYFFLSFAISAWCMWVLLFCTHAHRVNCGEYIDVAYTPHHLHVSLLPPIPPPPLLPPPLSKMTYFPSLLFFSRYYCCGFSGSTALGFFFVVVSRILSHYSSFFQLNTEHDHLEVDI